MKINSIKISNIYSFGFLEDINSSEGVSFEGNLNILIGPNGAGKSNFIEIISQLFKRGLIKPENYNENIIKSNNTINFNSVLTYGEENNQSFFNHMQKNKFSNSDNKQILIEVAFNQYDFENMRFVVDNLATINEIFAKYGSNIPVFSGDVNIDEIRKHENISILLIQNATNQNPHVVQFLGDNSVGKEFIKWYIEHFEFIKRIIEIYNKYEKSENKWPQLKNTFALIGCYRNYNAFTEGYSITPDEQGSINEAREKIKNESTKSNSNNEPAVFDFIKRKLSYRFNYLLNHESLTQTEVEQKIREEELLSNINSLLLKYLKIEVFINRTSDTDLNHKISFKDDEDNQVNIEELSAGEKGILHFIFSLYGYDLKNGLMIIDEPELHLHPQIQQAYLKIMERVKEEFDIQFIFATHSPLFVNVDTIDNVYRFYQKDKATKIIHPNISASEKDLVRILNYTNSSKIFFSNKVVLVEGESDEFFYRKFWSYFKQKNNIDKDELEFINIEGKGKREVWEKFLKKFKVVTYFVGDWDNVVEVGLIEKKFIDSISNSYSKKILKKFDMEINKKNSADRIQLLVALNNYLDNQTLTNIKKIENLRNYMVSRFIPYGDLIETLKEDDVKKYNEISKRITEEYKKGIFILKHGELEDYLSITKGLESTIEFCKEDSFNEWRLANKNQEKLSEFEEIFRIMSKK